MTKPFQSRRSQAKTKRGPTVFKPAVKARVNQVQILNIQDLADDGRGIARDAQGKTVFVEGALAGERVEAAIIRERSAFNEANLVTIDVASDDRVSPPCIYYERCGGCQLQHLNSEVQHRWRTAQLERRLHITAQPILTADDVGYRHRLRLSVRNGFIGLLEKRSQRVVEIDRCLVADEALNHVLPKVIDWLKSSLNRLAVKEVHIASGSLGLVGSSVGVSIVGDRVADAAWMNAFADSAPDNVHFYQLKTQEGDLLWENNDVPLLESRNGMRFVPGDFTQANPKINQMLIETAVAALDAKPGDTIADMFCGLGNFALPLSKSGATVTGFELDKQLLQRAEKQSSDTAHLSFQYADLFSPRKNLLAGFNKLLLDPPRAGAKAVCELLVGSDVQRIVYVSCDLATLERDISTLSTHFDVVETRIANMFPQTRHSESITVLQRRP